MHQSLNGVLRDLFSQLYACRFEGNVAQLRIFRGIILSDNVRAHGPGWSWHAERVAVHFSWHDLLLKKKLSLAIVADEVDMQSTAMPPYTTAAAVPLLGHLEKWAEPAKFIIPVDITTFVVQRAKLDIDEVGGKESERKNASIRFWLGACGTADEWSAQIYVQDMRVNQEERELGHVTYGLIDASLPLSAHAKPSATAIIEGTTYATPHNFWVTKARWDGTSATVQLTDRQNNALQIDGTIDDKKNVAAKGHVAAAFIASVIRPELQQRISGTVAGSITTKWPEWHTQTTVQYALSDCVLDGVPLPHISGDAVLEAEKRSGVLRIDKYPGLSGVIDSAWEWQGTAEKGVLSMRLLQPVAYAGVTMKNGTATASGRVRWPLNITGIIKTVVAYPVDLNHSDTTKIRTRESAIEGTYTVSPHAIELSAVGEKLPVYARIALDKNEPIAAVSDVRLQSHALGLHVATDGRFTGSARWGVIAPFLPSGLVESALDGFADNGRITFAGRYAEGTITSAVKVSGVNVYVPLMQTVVRELTADCVIDRARRTIDIAPLHATLARGTMSARCARVAFDEQWHIQAAYLPLAFDKIFVNVKQYAWAQLSGLLVGEYARGVRTGLSGAVILNESYVNENMLSPEVRADVLRTMPFMQQSAQKDKVALPAWLEKCTIDVRCCTEQPVEMKTMFWDARVQSALTCQGTVAAPLISGGMQLVGGTIAFPYRPLHITRGSITFNAHVLDDPRISIIARNTVNRYQVEMMVTGSVNNPVIDFTSLPYLERDEIIALLLGGAVEGTVGVAVPQALTESVERLLLGSRDGQNWKRKYIAPLISPLKRIKLIPRFTSETGRGGIKGSLAIEVDERLRGWVEKNFSLPEDVALGVEYAISDDAAARVLRDERGDWGGELEWRWKW